MQGKKDYQEKLFTSFQLSERIPKENFYRRLKEVLDLDFLYKETKQYYGDCGQKSIDPVVFFKLSMVSYLENDCSIDRLLPLQDPTDNFRGNQKIPLRFDLQMFR
jgi:hypothetical protein